jgi:hypothetical protein
LEKISEKIAALLTAQNLAAFDPVRLADIDKELEMVRVDQASLEEEWLATTLALGN